MWMKHTLASSGDVNNVWGYATCETDVRWTNNRALGTLSYEYKV